MSGLSCDHAAMRKSVRAFYCGTYGWTLQDFGDVPVALFGNCKHCHSTIGIHIEIPDDETQAEEDEPPPVRQPESRYHFDKGTDE